MKKREYLQPQTEIISAYADEDVMVNIGGGDTSIPLAKPSLSEDSNGEKGTIWEE